jgi:hypothetical protein
VLCFRIHNHDNSPLLSFAINKTMELLPSEEELLQRLLSEHVRKDPIHFTDMHISRGISAYKFALFNCRDLGDPSKRSATMELLASRFDVEDMDVDASDNEKERILVNACCQYYHSEHNKRYAKYKALDSNNEKGYMCRKIKVRGGVFHEANAEEQFNFMLLSGMEIPIAEASLVKVNADANVILKEWNKLDSQPVTWVDHFHCPKQTRAYKQVNARKAQDKADKGKVACILNPFALWAEEIISGNCDDVGALGAALQFVTQRRAVGIRHPSITYEVVGEYQLKINVLPKSGDGPAFVDTDEVVDTVCGDSADIANGFTVHTVTLATKVKDAIDRVRKMHSKLKQGAGIVKHYRDLVNSAIKKLAVLQPIMRSYKQHFSKNFTAHNLRACGISYLYYTFVKSGKVPKVVDDGCVYISFCKQYLGHKRMESSCAYVTIRAVDNVEVTPPVVEQADEGVAESGGQGLEDVINDGDGDGDGDDNSKGSDDNDGNNNDETQSGIDMGTDDTDDEAAIDDITQQARDAVDASRKILLNHESKLHAIQVLQSSVAPASQKRKWVEVMWEHL